MQHVIRSGYYDYPSLTCSMLLLVAAAHIHAWVTRIVLSSAEAAAHCVHVWETAGA